jgi:hypothetical protein
MQRLTHSQRKMSRQPDYSLYSGTPSIELSPTPSAVHTSSSPQPRLRESPSSPPSAGPAGSGTGRSFPLIRPALGDDVFSTPGDHPAATGTYTLNLPKKITSGVRAPCVASSSRSRGHNFPRSPRFIRLLCVRNYRREILADMGYAHIALVNHAREKARLQRQLDHHRECVRDLEARVREYDELVQAGVSRHIYFSEGLTYLARRESCLVNQYTNERPYVEDHSQETPGSSVNDSATKHQAAVQDSGGQSRKDDIAATTERNDTEE